MKFLVDVQLPRHLTRWLSEAGHDALHTLDLPKKNGTPDDEIIALAKRDERIVVTKDDDFVQSWLLTAPPLLLISTGNISNKELEKLLRANLPSVGVQSRLLVVRSYLLNGRKHDGTSAAWKRRHDRGSASSDTAWSREREVSGGALRN